MNNFTNDYLYNNNYSKPTALNGAVGGHKEKCKNIIGKLGQKHIKHPNPQEREDMGELAYVEKLKRSDCPISLNPETASFIDVGIHAIKRQRLSKSTVEKNLRYARFMESHPCPVDFRNPNLENFINHMDYREEIENAGPHGLCHEWKTMKIFPKAYGIPLTDWSYKPPSAPRSHKRILPFPDVVHKFIHHQYSKNRYVNALYQYLFCHSFLIGWRVPSEICELKTSDVKINDDGTGCIIITETKKNRSQRTIFPNKLLLDSKTHKSFKNWMDHWRSKVENQHSGDTFYLQPDGRPFTVRHLGHKLSKYGKQVWQPFQPYDMRHWCAVSRLINQKVKTGEFDVIPVKNWLGHEKIQTTMNYIRYAEQYYNQAPYDWMQVLLKFQKMEGQKGLKVVKVVPKQPQKTFVSSGNSPRDQSGPGRN